MRSCFSLTIAIANSSSKNTPGCTTRFSLVSLARLADRELALDRFAAIVGVRSLLVMCAWIMHRGWSERGPASRPGSYPPIPCNTPSHTDRVDLDEPTPVLKGYLQTSDDLLDTNTNVGKRYARDATTIGWFMKEP